MLFKKMADDQCRAAKEAMRKHQTKIKDAILAAGLVDVLDEFETNGFITEGVKLDLKDDRTGKSEGDRASSLVDKIRRSSFTYYPDETMKRFLKILEKKCGLPGEGVVKEIRKDCESVIIANELLIIKFCSAQLQIRIYHNSPIMGRKLKVS